MVEHKGPLLLPLVGIALLSLGLVGCGSPNTTTHALAEAGEPSSEPFKDYPDHLASIVEQSRFQAWREKVAAAGFDPVIGEWGMATAILVDDGDPSPLALRMIPLFDIASEQIPSVGSVSVKEERFSLTHTLEVWDQKARGIMDRLGLRRSGDLGAVKYKWKDYANIQRVVDEPVRFWLWSASRVLTETNIQLLMNGLPLS